MNEIKVYSIDGKDTVVGEATKLNVSNVWNQDKFVEIQVGGGPKVVVKASELLKAVSNSMGNEFYL